VNTRNKLESMFEEAVVAYSQVDLTLLALTLGTAEYRTKPLLNSEMRTLRIKICNAANSTKGFSCRIILKRIFFFEGLWLCRGVVCVLKDDFCPFASFVNSVTNCCYFPYQVSK
jgi:hypothetical protein